MAEQSEFKKKPCLLFDRYLSSVHTDNRSEKSMTEQPEQKKKYIRKKKKKIVPYSQNICT